MKQLYLVRHGETLFNQRNLIQGIVNAPLILEGVAQALHTKKAYFEKNGITYDHVYSSPEGRAVQTTELLTDLPFERVYDLHEMSFGKLEGCPVYLGCPPSEFNTYYKTIGGESTAEVQARMNKALFSIMNQDENESVLAVAHGCANQAFYEFWKNYNQVNEENPILNNCSVLHYTFDPENQTFILVDVFNEDYETDALEAARKTGMGLPF